MHRIRLHGPWQALQINDAVVRLERPFHSPSGVESTTRLALQWRLSERVNSCQAFLNGKACELERIEEFWSTDISAIIQVYNSFAIDLTIAHLPPGWTIGRFTPNLDSPFLREVRLEIQNSLDSAGP